MISILAAAQLSSPEPIDLSKWFSPRDIYYRVAARGANQENLLRITIRPDGSLRRCEIEGPSRDVQLDNHACNLVRQRAKYRPATWIDGSPAYGVDRFNIHWQVGYADTVEHYDKDVDLIYRKPPKGVKYVAVMVAVDEAGSIVSCTGEPRWAEPPKVPPEIIDLACRQVVAGYQPKPVVDERGAPVRSVQLARVRLKKW
jgi:TonB family protein